MKLTKVTKRHPLRRKKIWERFLGEKCRGAYFQCMVSYASLDWTTTIDEYFQDCKRTWTSNKGWVRFWIWRDEPDANGRRRGHVAAYVFGQKCEKCYDKNVVSCPTLILTNKLLTLRAKYLQNLGYALGHLPRDEIEAVLSFLLMDIDYHFYGNKNYTNIDENEIENKRRNFQYRRKPPARAHFEKGCQACTFKVCGKGFSKNFPEKVDPTEN